MAIKCSAETTITNQIDATDLIMWYYATTLTTKPLSPSTTSASATPTGWSLIEPTITSASDLSKYIYECLQIVWGDGTCSWGDVQLSASFEAAKQAYNLAHSTASIFATFEQTHNKTLVDTVDESSSTITTLTESHQYGGINLLSNTKSIDPLITPYTNSNISLYSNQTPIDGESFYYCSGSKYFQIDFPTLINNQKYTLSFDISRSSDSQPVFVKIDGTETNIGTAATTWTRLSHTFTANSSITNAQIRVAFDSTSSTTTYVAAIRHIKLEQGSLATPWEYSSNDISTLSNTVNTISQKADTNESKISSLTTALGTNADGTSKENDIIHKVSDINQNLESITTRVGRTEVSLKGTYATSSTAANIQNKEATIFPAITNFELYKGAAITVKFINDNTISNPTLNINSSGAKPIKTYSGANLSEAEYKWDAGATMTFVYDGTYWRIQDSTELTRIKSAETIIDQTAKNVLIKATENDSTAAQGGQHIIQSLINVAPEGIQISADKVDIEGAAIFSSNGRLSQNSLNEAYASKSSAITEEQIIYIQAVSDTNSINAYPSSATTTSSYWVTETGESIPSGTPPNSVANQTPRWTTKRPCYQTNYPVLFVAKQRKTVSGVITCTTPIKDDTTTIIDGGHITTGAIDAGLITTGTLNAGGITVTNLTAENIIADTINGEPITQAALNGNIQNNINIISDATTSALNNLATIEDVVDVVEWLSAHSKITDDTTVLSEKDYYVRDESQVMHRIESVIDPSALNWVEAIESEDTEAVDGKTYYELDAGTGVLTPVTNVSEGADPSALGWWEVAATSDTTMSRLKDYYTVDSGTGVASPLDPSTLGWLEMDDAVTQYLASHIAMTDHGLNIMVDSTSGYIHLGTLDGDHEYGTYIIGGGGVSEANFGKYTRIGRYDRLHVDITDGSETTATVKRMFSIANAGDPPVMYVEVDTETKESTVYMTNAVVVQNLCFGNWMWYERPNGNMSVKWMGSDA